MTADSKISCEKDGSHTVSLRPYFGPLDKFDLEFSMGKVHWNFEVGAKASINPLVAVEGTLKCELDLPHKSFQIKMYPVPINLTFTPIVEGSATAKLSLEGPETALVLGIKSAGYFGLATKWCDAWITEFPCGIKVGMDHETGPLAELRVGDAEVVLEGELGLDLGLNAELAFGVNNIFIDARIGASFKLIPVAAKVAAKVGTTTCAKLELGAKLGVGMFGSGKLLGFEKKEEFELWEGEVTYPGAEVEFGDCGDDD